jgi:hypothetical protein
MDVSESSSSIYTATSSNAYTFDDEIFQAVMEKDMEKLWAKEQYEMPQIDREAATDELHGVKSRYNEMEYENPENHYHALIQFDNQLNNPNLGIPSHLKDNYLRALGMNSTYVSSSNFRLRFLRCEFFDIPKAIVRFCKYLNLMVEMFGDISLLREIFLSDLTKSERKLLKEGGMQLSPARDTLGRRILFFLGNCGANYSPRERDRVGIYLIYQVLAEDVTTQRNGLVSIHLLDHDVMKTMMGENKAQSANFFGAIFDSCPLRFSAIHMCFPNDLLFRLLKPTMLLVVGSFGRKVLRVHSGTTIECNYILSSFGVRLDDIPTTYSGTIKTRQHMRWMKVRSAMDEFIKKQCNDNVDGNYRYFYASDLYTIQPFPHVQCPEINCVLFHQNGVAWEFPGNIKFRAFLDDQMQNNIHLNNRSSSDNLRSIGSGADAQFISPENEGLFDRIIRLSIEQNFQFLLHDESKHWYIDLKEPDSLRRYIGFAIRGRQRRVSAQRYQQNNNATLTTPRQAVFTDMDGHRRKNCGPDVCFNR